MRKLWRQLAQVEQVDGSVDFSGFGSSCSRCFWPPWGPAFRSWEAFWARNGCGRLVLGSMINEPAFGLNETRCHAPLKIGGTLHWENDEQSRYTISKRLATTASMLPHGAENLRQGQVVLRSASYSLLFKRRRAALMINDQRSMIKKFGKCRAAPL